MESLHGAQRVRRSTSSPLPGSGGRSATAACRSHVGPDGPSACRGSPSRTNPQLDTPFKNPSGENVTEIEVTDPTHPLFGRRFPVLSISSPPQGYGQVFVSYRDYMILRIPLLSTNLTPYRPAGQTKLCLEALTDLISLAEQCEVLCPSTLQQSGSDCLQDSKPKSSTTCRRSSRR